MPGSQTQFQIYLEEEINRYKGILMPVKSGFLRRVFVW